MRNKRDMAKWLEAQLAKDAEARAKDFRRKMPAEELSVYMRERSRGTGVHGARSKPRDKNVRAWDE